MKNTLEALPPPWILGAGAVLLPLALAGLFALRTARVEKSRVEEILLRQAESVALTLEAGSRAGMMRAFWQEGTLSSLLEESAGQPGVEGIVILGPDGEVLAAGGNRVPRGGEEGDIPALLPGKTASWGFTRDGGTFLYQRILAVPAERGPGRGPVTRPGMRRMMAERGNEGVADPSGGMACRDPSGRSWPEGARVWVTLEAGTPLEIGERRVAGSLVLAFLVAAAASGILGLVFWGWKAREAELALAQAREYARRLEDLAATTAHEIRNPLGAIRGLAQLLAGGAGTDLERTTRTMVEEVDRLDRVVNGLLSYARPVVLRRGRHRVLEVLRHAAALAEGDAAVREVRFRLEADPPGLEAGFDRDLLVQGLLNLVLNAVEASPRGGTVDLGVREAGGRVEFSVADRGPGIPSEVRDRLFHLFVSGRPGGTGLGLAIVKKIADLHGGTVRVQPRPGGGTEVFLDVPPEGG